MVWERLAGRHTGDPLACGEGLGLSTELPEQGMTRRPYASRSFSRSVVIGSTFWGTLVLGPRQCSIANSRVYAEIPNSRKVPQWHEAYNPYLVDDGYEDEEEEVVATEWNWGKKTVMVPNP